MTPDLHPLRRQLGWISCPAISVASVTPNDSVDLPYMAVQLRATGAGDVSYVTLNGDTDTVSLAAGECLPQPVLVTRVKATGTSATGIKAYY